jgi:hypothetical protein
MLQLEGGREGGREGGGVLLIFELIVKNSLCSYLTVGF